MAAPATTKVTRNENLAALQAGYLFPEIAKRRRAHAEKNPGARIISLGIGDTTEPIPAPIASAMETAAAGLGTLAGYSGYGAEQGVGALRQALAETFYPGLGVTAVRDLCSVTSPAHAAPERVVCERRKQV